MKLDYKIPFTRQNNISRSQLLLRNSRLKLSFQLRSVAQGESFVTGLVTQVDIDRMSRIRAG